MTTVTSKLTRIASIAGFAVGAFALAAVAGTWTPPPCNTPSQCNVDAPLNVGTTSQAKQGALAIGKSAPANGYLFDVNGNGIFNNLGVSGNLFVAGMATTTTLSTTYLQVAPATTRYCTAWSKLPHNDSNCTTYTSTPTNEAGQFLIGKDSAGDVTWGAPPSPTLGAGGTEYKGGAYSSGINCDSGYYVSGIYYTANGDANVAGINCTQITVSQN